jgi:hypothetical protein
MKHVFSGEHLFYSVFPAHPVFPAMGDHAGTIASRNPGRVVFVGDSATQNRVCHASAGKKITGS